MITLAFLSVAFLMFLKGPRLSQDRGLLATPASHHFLTAAPAVSSCHWPTHVLVCVLATCCHAGVGGRTHPSSLQHLQGLAQCVATRGSSGSGCAPSARAGASLGCTGCLCSGETTEPWGSEAVHRAAVTDVAEPLAVCAPARLLGSSSGLTSTASEAGVEPRHGFAGLQSVSPSVCGQIRQVRQLVSIFIF